MIENVYEPLAEYRDRYRAAFAENARAKFDALVEESGIDVAANARTMAELRQLEAEHGVLSRKRMWWRLVLTGTCLAAGYLVYLGWCDYVDRESATSTAWVWTKIALEAIGVFGLVFTGCRYLLPIIRRLSARLADLARLIQEKKDEGWRQLAPLNALFDWDVVPELIERTVPRIRMDRRFSNGRLYDLCHSYDWDGAFNKDKSILVAQSGEIHGNPFVLAETLERSDGVKTYEGSLEIEWREKERDSDGDWHWVTKQQTLRAEIERFIPVYDKRKYLIYGCTAAPKLIFSRVPQGLSGDGALVSAKRRAELKRLEKKAWKGGASGNFTLLANDDFEVQFHADNRNDEQQFRVLFTPVAQQQMLKLLNDDKEGWGDDFTFSKKKMINIIQATHLDKTDLDTDPRHFMGYDLKVVREHFAEFTGSYFRSFYFSMAPLLAIPLYQLTRSHDDIWKTPHDRQSSFWEHETMANYQGQDLFRHPDSVTKNLLETAVVSENEDRQVLNVTAHGYRGVPRVDYVSVKGGDGYYHDVPVHWTEYLPVSRSSLMTVAENNELSLPAFRRKTLSEPALSHAVEGGQWKDVENYFRRSMVAFLGDVPLVASEMAQEKKADSESVEAE